MSSPILTATLRQKSSADLPRMRQTGHIPAILYGNKVAPAMYWVRYLDFDKLYKTAGESTILELAPESGKAVNVLIHDVARDPETDRYIHVDFYQVNMTEEIEADVPLEFVGESPAVKEQSGILVRSLDEISIKCLPKDLPHSIRVDISSLKTFDDQIKVSDLPLPAGVKLDEAGDTVIATVDRPRSEAEMAALDEKVEMDVTKVEGMVKEEAPAEGADAGKDSAPAEKKEGKE